VWERLGVYRRQAQQEAESLKQILETAIRGKGLHGPRAGARRDDPGCSPTSDHALAEKILLLFSNHLPPFDLAFELQDKLRAALYTLLTQRHGAGPRFKGFKPRRLDEWEKEWEEHEREWEKGKREQEQYERENRGLWAMLRAAQAGDKEFAAWKEKYQRSYDAARERLKKQTNVAGDG
jgi:hypothetical protein